METTSIVGHVMRDLTDVREGRMLINQSRIRIGNISPYGKDQILHPRRNL